MIKRLYSAAVEGIKGYEVQVEVDARPVEDTGRISIVGLPDAAVRESVERVTSALSNSSFFRPGNVVVTVNLAPADVRKQGPGFDLPIALALEMAIQENYRDVPEAYVRRVPAGLDDWCIVGELALDGVVRGVRGVLPLAVAARDAGRRMMMVAPENAAEAAVVDGLAVYTVENLREAWDVLVNPARFTPYVLPESAAPLPSEIDFDEVKGQNER